MSTKTVQNWNYSGITSFLLFDGSSDEVAHELPVVQEINSSHAGYIDGPFSRSPTSSTISSGLQHAKPFRKSIISAIFEVASFKSSSPSLRGSSHSTGPPQFSKPGYEWVWFPEGYWAEREIVGCIKNKGTTKRGKRSSDGHASAHSVTEISERAPPKDESRRLRKASSPDQAVENTDGHSRLGEGSGSSSVQMTFRSLQYTPPKGKSESLYGKTKRVLRWRFFPKKEKAPPDEVPPRSPHGVESQTADTLEGTTNYFARFQPQKRKRHNTPSPEEDSLKSRQKRIGLAPWHRNNSPVPEWSATSSVRKLLMGKTPTTTPCPDAISNINSDRHFEGEVPSFDFDAGAPIVQGIRRINTPPGLEESPTGRARGLFFDLTLPSADNNNNDPSDLSQTSSNKSSTKTTRFMTPGGRVRQWWDDDDDHLAPRARRQIGRNFVFDIPDHLPSSPLCPMHPKHKSGGKGVCPLHGREKSKDEDPAANEEGYE